MDDPEKLKVLLEKSSENDLQMMQAGTLVDWLSTLSAVVLEVGNSGKYKFQVGKNVSMRFFFIYL